MRWGRVALGLLGSVAVVAAAGAGAWVWVGRADFAALAAGRASAALGRPVQVGTLRVTPGRWLRIEAADAKLDNVEGGTRPAMVEVGRLTAEVEAWSLLHGPIVVRRLDVDGLRVLLERGSGGVRNWRFGPPRPDAPAADAVPKAPDARPGFPLLQDIRLRGSEVVFRTSGGTPLRTRLDEASLMTDAADAPVRLQVTGAYQDVPVTLRGDLDPTAALRQGKLFGAKLHFAVQGGTLDFDGTMLAPMDVDGASGALTLDAADAGPMLRMAGVKGSADPALRLAGTLERSGGDWSLTGGTGALNGSEVQAASLHLVEGDGGKPDRVEADLAFARLDLNELLGSGQRGRRTGADILLRVDPDPDTLVELHLTADALEYGDVLLEDAEVSAALEPGRVSVRQLALTYLGARAEASGRIVNAGSGAQASAELLVGGADVQRLRRALGFGAVPVQGRLSAQAEAQALAHGAERRRPVRPGVGGGGADRRQHRAGGGGDGVHRRARIVPLGAGLHSGRVHVGGAGHARGRGHAVAVAGAVGGWDDRRVWAVRPVSPGAGPYDRQRGADDQQLRAGHSGAGQRLLRQSGRAPGALVRQRTGGAGLYGCGVSIAAKPASHCPAKRLQPAVDSAGAGLPGAVPAGPGMRRAAHGHTPAAPHAQPDHSGAD